MAEFGEGSANVVTSYVDGQEIGVIAVGSETCIIYAEDVFEQYPKGWQESFTKDLDGVIVSWDLSTRVATISGISLTFVSALEGTNGTLFGKIAQ